jgi:hypothetical protein
MGKVIGPIEEITFRTLTMLRASIQYMEENNDGGRYNTLLSRERKMYQGLFEEIF